MTARAMFTSGKIVSTGARGKTVDLKAALELAEALSWAAREAERLAALAQRIGLVVAKAIIRLPTPTEWTIRVELEVSEPDEIG